MISFIRNWLTGITCAALAASLAEGLMPRGAVKQVGRLVCGLMLLWAALGPVLNVGIIDLSNSTANVQREIAGQRSALEKQNDSMLKTLIERETAAYIVDKAAETGMQCRVEVECAADEDGLWTPWSAEITGIFSALQQKELTAVITEQLGIPPQRQVYTGGEQP